MKKIKILLLAIIKSGLTVKETEEMVKDLDGYFVAQEKEKEEELEENKSEQTKSLRRKFKFDS